MNTENQNRSQKTSQTGELVGVDVPRLVLGSSIPQCMFASLSEKVPRCEKSATRKWGGLWFCDQHGSRDKADALMEKVELMREGNTAILPSGEIVARGTQGAMNYDSSENAGGMARELAAQDSDNSNDING